MKSSSQRIIVNVLSDFGITASSLIDLGNHTVYDR